MFAEKQRENEDIRDGCRAGGLEHLEDSEMRRSSGGTWAVRKSARCLIDDGCVWLSLCLFSCGGEKK